MRQVSEQTTLLWQGPAPGALGDGPEDRPRLTPYLVESHAPTPAILVLPGGGYRIRSEHEREPIALWLNTLGISAFVVDYRIAPYKHPVPLMDAQRAMRTVRFRADEWNIDPSRVGIIGFSAGGHLAATVSTQFDDGSPDAADPIERESSRPDAAILCYPVISFVDKGRHNGSWNFLLGPDADDAARRSLSAELNVTEEVPPVFLWHTSDDEVVSVRNSLLFATALREAKVPFALHVFPSGVHGLGLASGHPAAAWTDACGRWLQELGWGKGPRSEG